MILLCARTFRGFSVLVNLGLQPGRRWQRRHSAEQLPLSKHRWLASKQRPLLPSQLATMAAAPLCLAALPFKVKLFYWLAST